MQPTYAVVGGRGRISSEVRDLRHGADTDNTLNGQIGLVDQPASEIIGAQLVGGDEGVADEVLGPLIEEGFLNESC